MTERITALTSACPAYANRLVTADQMDSVTVIAALRLAAGDFVIVKPGETVPADGDIVSGATSVDESILTGESNAIRRGKKDTVFGGSINLTNSIVVQITKPASESTLASIANLLEDSMSTKPTGKRLTDQIAAKFSATVVVVAACVAVFWIWQDNSQWLAHTIAVLVVACPCALSLAVPTALTAAVNSAAKRGILLSNPDAIQPLSTANTFLFDKTGTLTRNDARLKQVTILGHIDREQCTKIANSLAHYSDHPISKALTSIAIEHPLQANKVITSEAGGVHGLCEGKMYYFGSSEYINQVAKVETLNDTLENDGLVAYLSDGNQVLGAFLFKNSLKNDAKNTIMQLQHDNLHLGIVTGDRKEEAQRIATQLGINDVHWNCSPADKLKIIRDHQNDGECVAMVGDGVNDAPTLAIANVSIAPANAQQIAKVHADVLLLDDKLELLIRARKLAEFTTRIMRKNTIWAITYNLIGISLAAAGYIPPVAAAIGMSVSSLLVVGNSLRITSH